MCNPGFICIEQQLYCLVILGIIVCICIIASIMGPPFNEQLGDEEQKAKKNKLTPDRKKRDDDAKGNDSKPTKPPTTPGAAAG